jgi:hypothetical protein
VARRFDYYLREIKVGESVNFREVVKSAEKVDINKSFLLKVFSVSKNYAEKEMHKITILENETFDSWLCKFDRPDGFDNRIDAGKGQSSSHDVKLSSTLMHLRKGNKFPFTLMVDEFGDVQPKFTRSESLLIIENEEVFNNISLAGAFLKEECGIDLSDMDILFGSGNRSANSYLSSFYNRYQEVYCFFDLELGALRTAKSIIDGSCECAVTFVMPSSVLGFIKSYGKKLSPSQYQQLKDIRVTTPELKFAVDIMLRTQQRLEQEAYL